MAYRRLTVASAVALAVATSGSVHAADPGSIEEIVVTATKREEILKDVAMGISAVSGTDLVRRNVISMAEARNAAANKDNFPG